MDKLADYLKEFAELLGLENKPVFVGIKNASIGLKGKVSARRRESVWRRVQEAKYRPTSRPARHLKALQTYMGRDGFREAELKDNEGKVLCLFRSEEQIPMQAMTVKKHGAVDGIVTGLKGADDTMHLYVRDQMSRDHNLVVRDEALARELLRHFRSGMVRLRVHGSWQRTEDGWVPESGKCVVDSYDQLDETPLVEVMAGLAAIPGNGWAEADDPMAVWRELRGIH
ncbi:hypothetical protein CKY51_11130 [Xanthomonas maliensis]|nr:hypothetical protein CKY51_11130 [Xanthomonas maliensis]